MLIPGPAPSILRANLSREAGQHSSVCLPLLHWPGDCIALPYPHLLLFRQNKRSFSFVCSLFNGKQSSSYCFCLFAENGDDLHSMARNQSLAIASFPKTHPNGGEMATNGYLCAGELRLCKGLQVFLQDFMCIFRIFFSLWNFEKWRELSCF